MTKKNKALQPLDDALKVFKDTAVGIVQLMLPLAGVGVSVLDKYYEGVRFNQRFEEIESYQAKLNSKLKDKQDKINKDFIESTLLFRLEDIAAKLLRYPKKGWDEVLSDYVAESLTRSEGDYPTEAKSLILSSLLELDIVDIKVLKQIYIQVGFNVRNNQSPGVKFESLVEMMKSSGLDSIIVERSLDRLSAQSLVKPFNTQPVSIQNMPPKGDILEGKRSPNFFPSSGYTHTPYGFRFVKFLNLA